MAMQIRIVALWVMALFHL